jgi:tRNA(Ile)-lysidine synthase TilS/MesJ
MHLCQAHFDEDVHRKIRESLRQTRLFGRGERVAVGLSGGGDSATLLYVLKNMFSRRKDIDFVAIIIDEGQGVAQARLISQKLGVPSIIRSMHSSTGSRAKADLLIKTAQESGADVLATGHNLDDEAQEVFLKFLKGDVEGLLQPSPGRPIPWIKPLRRVPEKETRLYAITHGLYHHKSECFTFGWRLEVKRHLNGFESRHPGTKYSLLRSLERILLLKE